MADRDLGDNPEFLPLRTTLRLALKLPLVIC